MQRFVDAGKVREERRVDTLQPFRAVQIGEFQVVGELQHGGVPGGYCEQELYGRRCGGFNRAPGVPGIASARLLGQGARFSGLIRSRGTQCPVTATPATGP